MSWSDAVLPILEDGNEVLLEDAREVENGMRKVWVSSVGIMRTISGAHWTFSHLIITG